jgi:hypothetical protein
MASRINPIGISSHLERLPPSDVTRQLDLMQSAGIQWIRQEFSWNILEPSSGTWNFSNYDFIVSQIVSRGMQIIGLLAQYNTPAWYRGSNPSNQPPPPNDYVNWISQVVSRYSGQITLWEIGNEPNQNQSWYPVSDPVAYTALLQFGYNAIKTIDPITKVISAGLSQNNSQTFLQSMYTAGAKGYFDYFGYHPYIQPNGPNDHGVANFSILGILQGIMNANGDNKQIMVTEVGWPTYTGSNGISEANQALYIGQVYQDIMHGNYQYIPIACIYDFLDDGTDANNPEDHFGLLRPDYSQKPSYSSMQSARADYNANFTPINP